MDSVNELKDVTSSLNDQLEELNTTFHENWHGLSDDEWMKFHLLELNLNRGQVCFDRLSSQTRLVEKKGEEFTRFFTPSHEEHTKTTSKRSVGFSILQSMVDLAPNLLGLGSNAFDYFKEREKNRKFDNLDQRMSSFESSSNWKFGKVNKVLL
jgi:hypothetical protein